MSIRDVGSYIGHNRVTTTSQDSASGIWSLAAVERQRRASAWPEGSTDPDFASVSLLLHMDGSGSTFTDSSGTPKTLTASGNATQSTAQSRFGGKSAYFDGTGDYLTVSDEGQFDFSGDFTIEFFAYSSRTPGEREVFFSKRSAGAFGGVLLNHLADRRLQMVATADNSSWAVNAQTAAATFPLNTWSHIAVVRSGSTMTLYVDGVSKATGTISGAIANNSEPFVICAGASNGEEAFAGYIDEFRVSKRARYLSAFTPPSAAFPDAGPFPVAGLKMWLDGSDASTLFTATSGGSAVAADGTVARWEDKSGNGNHFTSSSGPQRKAAVHNGKDTVRFVDKFMTGFTPSSVFSGATAATVFAVMRVDTAPGVLFDKIGSAGDNWTPFVGNGKVYDDFASNVRRDTGWVMPLNSLHIISFESSASDWRLLVNGTQQYAAGSNTVEFGSSAVLMGRNGGLFSGNAAAQDICEIILYSSVLSSGDRTSAVNYLKAKWGIE